MLKHTLLPSVLTNRPEAPLKALRGAKGDKALERERLKEVSKEFEGLLVEMMVREMRKNVPESPLLGKSTGHQIFEEMLDSEYVRRMVDQGGLGIADMMVRQLADKE